MSPEEFEREWERCKAWIEAALHRGGDMHTLDSIKEDIEEGRKEFWPVVDAAVVTQLIGPQLHEFNIYLAGGNMERLRDMLPTLEEYGKVQGCKIITIQGRVGWMRTFLVSELKYQPVAVLLGKELTNG